MRPSSVLLALLVALAPAGCGAAPDGQEPAASPHGAWQLVSGRGPEGALEPLDSHQVTLVVEEDQVGGTAACNSYGGTARIHDERLELEELAQTDMACEPREVMSLERTYLDALVAADTIRREGDVLLLTGPDVELRFAPVPPVPAEQLVGTDWELDTLVEGETASTPTAAAILRLDGDGTLAGTTGCRGFDGAYAVGADEVRVTRLELDGECAPELAAQDDLVVRVLGDGFRAEVEGDRLTLTARADGLVYRAR